MTESEKRREELLRRARTIYSDKNPACGTSKISVVLYEIV